MNGIHRLDVRFRSWCVCTIKQIMLPSWPCRLWAVAGKCAQLLAVQISLLALHKQRTARESVNDIRFADYDYTTPYLAKANIVSYFLHLKLQPHGCFTVRWACSPWAVDSSGVCVCCGLVCTLTRLMGYINAGSSGNSNFLDDLEPFKMPLSSPWFANINLTLHWKVGTWLFTIVREHVKYSCFFQKGIQWSISVMDDSCSWRPVCSFMWPCCNHSSALINSPLEIHYIP